METHRKLTTICLFLGIGIQLQLFYVCEARWTSKSWNFWIKDRGYDGHCTYPGYKPGGVLPKIKPIVSPVAKADKDAISELLGIAEKGTAAASQMASIAEAFAKEAGKTAPKVAAALGVFGVALGIITDLTKPSAQDILDNANAAIRKLTNEVNKRFQQMEGYTDKRVLDIGRELVKSDFQTLYNLWKNCIKESSKAQADDCQQDAIRYIEASQPKFMKLRSLMNAYDPKKWERATRPNHYEVKGIETRLTIFRDYATLHLMALQALINTLKDDKSAVGKLSYKRYLKDMQKSLLLYHRYAYWAYRWIHVRHYDENVDSSKWWK